MDMYSTSFVYPRRPRLTHASFDFQNAPSSDFGPGAYGHHQNGFRYPNNQSGSTVLQNQEEYEAMQASIHANVVMASHQHGVSITPNALDEGLCWNYCVSGVTRQVMLARENLLRGCPDNVGFCLPTLNPSVRLVNHSI
jgi:hypothetical protein